MKMKRKERSTNRQNEDKLIRIPDCTIVTKLDENASGSTFLAKHRILGKVRVKVFRDNDETRKKIEKVCEFNKRARDFTYTIRIYDVGRCVDQSTGQEVPYIISDYIDAEPVESSGADREYRIRRDITKRDAYLVIRKLLSGVFRTHMSAAGFRVLGLHNVLVSSDHETVFIDGLEAVLAAEEFKAGDSTINLERYAAPEVLRDPESASFASDIYSAAVCLLHMITKDPNALRGINSLGRRGYDRELGRTLRRFNLREQEIKLLRISLAHNPDRKSVV